MYLIRRFAERGFRDHGWLQTYHTFSFGDYEDPRWRQFGSLRVLNEDFVHPGRGFGTHPHRDMEILTYIISGTLEHQDSLGNGAQINPGEMQYMSAGSGVLHSEFNPSSQAPVHLLQMWILPNMRGAQPRYGQIALQAGQGLHLVAVPEGSGAEEVIQLRADAWIFEGRFSASESLAYEPKGTHQWLHMVEGKISLNNHDVDQGDGLGIQDETELQITILEDSIFLLFDMK